MSSPPPARVFPASQREAVVRCPPCGCAIVMDELVTSCPACGTVHHAECWTRNGGCGTYACAPARREEVPAGAPTMRITADEIERAPARIILTADHGAQLSRLSWEAESNVPRRWNKLCVAAFIASLVSIPAFGMLTGWIAVLLGCIGLVLRRPRQRGLWLAALSVLIGIGSALGWTFWYFGDTPLGGSVALTFDKYDLDPASLESLPPQIARPMRSNVLISSSAGFGGLAQMVGSGVVVKVAADSVTILTNRHVVDAKFTGPEDADKPKPDGDCSVKFIGHPTMKGSVAWIAPFGVDAALLQVAMLDTKDIVAACWAKKPTCQISDRVFAIGNPMGLGWSHASGDISQIRRQDFGPLDLRVIQTSAPVNHGNSGGGLYDERGLLIGINTWTQDKRMAEGLGFSISYQSILELIPKEFGLPPSRDP